MTGGGVVLVSSSSSSSCNGCRGEEGGGGGGGAKRAVAAKEKAELMMMEEGDEGDGQSQLSLLALVLAALRRSVVSSCRMEQEADEDGSVAAAALRHMEIGWPTDVRHVTHVTFDRFNGFLGLPVEFELEVPSRAPSASASVFGVSAESMQCSYDSKGNSVPTILLLMQERLYTQGGLKAEGIFRINPENSQEEHVREQLNRGIVPEDIDVHCLAGLIKAWFRELPEGVLDGLSPEQVLQCNTEEEFVELVKLLLPTQTALLNWAIELMADVVEEEELNKMNARNIAMVFAPNMTQMSDPLTALMHAVQVMNLLKSLILKTLRDREDAAMSGYSPFSCSPSSNHLHDDEYDSQQEEVDMSGGSKGSSSDEHELSDSGRRIEGRRQCTHNVRYSTDDDSDSLRDIEECFLKQLEWKANDGNSGGDSTSQGVSSTQNVSKSESKQETENTGNEAESKSKQETENIGNEAESKPAKEDADAVAHASLKDEQSAELGMDECKWMVL